MLYTLVLHISINLKTYIMSYYMLPNGVLTTDLNDWILYDKN